MVTDDCTDPIVQPIKNRKEPKPEQKSMFIKDGVLWEQIYDPKTEISSFVTWDYKTNNLVQLSYQTYNGKRIIPNSNELIKKNCVILPSGVLPYGSVDQLEKEIYDFSYQYLDISKEHRKLTIWYNRLSWTTDFINTIPYMKIQGDYGTGKTRYEDVVGGLCYKPMFVGGAVRSAPIYRVIDQWRGTAVFDEFTLTKSDETQDIIQILNNGFQRGKPVLRCKDGNYSEVECFDPFGPKILATRKELTDKATESRCITEIAVVSPRKDIPIDLSLEFFEKRQELQNKLLMYRFDYWNKIKTSSSICATEFGNVLPRIKQTYLPFVPLFINDKGKLDNFIKSVKRTNNELVEMNASTIDGSIIHAYLELVQKGEKYITPSDISSHIGNEKLNSVSVGKRVKTLGFKTTQTRVGDSIKKLVKISIPAMEQLIYRYVTLEEQESMVVMFSKSTCVSDVLDVSVVTGQVDGIDWHSINLKSSCTDTIDTPDTTDNKTPSFLPKSEKENHVLNEIKKLNISKKDKEILTKKDDDGSTTIEG